MIAQSPRPATTSIADLERALTESPRRWLVTGAAGFIGSHLVERLLGLGQWVTGLDDFSGGCQSNLDEAIAGAGEGAGSRFELVEGDIRDVDACQRATAGADYVLHQAALGSVPYSFENPERVNEVNVTGFLNIALAALRVGAQRFVFASSSSVYGDDERLPRREGNEGRALSPYAATKRTGELYADLFWRTQRLPQIGLRYFNVYGPRQKPTGPYAAVIPRWIEAMSRGEPCTVYGDGETARDFCHVADVVSANLLAAFAPDDAIGGVYNIAAGSETTLNELHDLLAGRVRAIRPRLDVPPSRHEPFREGDVRRSLADVSRAAHDIGFEPTIELRDGLEQTVPWYLERIGQEAQPAAAEQPR